MKQLSFIFILFVSVSALSQDDAEEMVNFKSPLIDYEVYNDKVVAITRKNQEYFLFYEDTKGAKLFESIDIFFATDLEIDCMGNLFLVGVDSAYQLDISDRITKVQTLDFQTYETNISTCKALFNQSLVREAENNSLVYEPLDDSIYAKHPILFTIQVWSDAFVSPGDNAPNPRSINTDDATLVYNHQLNLERDVVSQIRPKPYDRDQTQRTYGGTSELTPFQVGDSLWVFDADNELLFIYDEYGKTDGVKEIDDLPLTFKLTQDLQTEDVYFISADRSERLIQKIDADGGLDMGFDFYKGFSRSDLKISNGYLYFRDSKGAGESIKRLQLN